MTVWTIFPDESAFKPLKVTIRIRNRVELLQLSNMINPSQTVEGDFSDRMSDLKSKLNELYYKEVK